jgi:ubiquinone/menaquinone biosynthesis C-methylase UbiE
LELAENVLYNKGMNNSGVKLSPQFSDHNSEQDIDIADTSNIPRYLDDTYWWAYIHPRSVLIFERQWLVNLILWGNFVRLRNQVLRELNSDADVNNLQIACVYGDFSRQLAGSMNENSELHIVDISPVQIKNIKEKLYGYQNIYINEQNSSSLHYQDRQFDNVIVFFLLHEQPEAIRAATVAEALRVVKPGGKVIFIDYHKPHWANPLRYFMNVVLRILEPYALGIWEKQIIDWVPEQVRIKKITKETYFGSLYQKVVMLK